MCFLVSTDILLPQAVDAKRKSRHDYDILLVGGIGVGPQGTQATTQFRLDPVVELPQVSRALPIGNSRLRRSDFTASGKVELPYLLGVPEEAGLEELGRGPVAEKGRPLSSIWWCNTWQWRQRQLQKVKAVAIQRPPDNIPSAAPMQEGAGLAIGSTRRTTPPGVTPVCGRAGVYAFGPWA